VHVIVLWLPSFLPRATQIIGYARTSMSLEEFHQRLTPYIKGDELKVQCFLKLCTYMHGDVSLLAAA
jgi:glucose-6-phosphate 1-dehydrogenase